MTQYAYINSTYRGIDGIIRYVNDTSGGIMMPLFLLAAFVIMLVSQLEQGFARALMTSSLIVSILSIFLTIADMLAPTYMYLSFVLVALAVFFTRLQTSSL